MRAHLEMGTTLLVAISLGLVLAGCADGTAEAVNQVQTASIAAHNPEAIEIAEPSLAEAPLTEAQPASGPERACECGGQCDGNCGGGCDGSCGGGADDGAGSGCPHLEAQSGCPYAEGRVASRGASTCGGGRNSAEAEYVRYH